MKLFADEMVGQPLVVAYGMGVDSTAMLVGLRDRGIRPDLIMFADTGSEKAETYAYLPIINAWLGKVGFPAVTVVRRKISRKGDRTLEDEIIRLKTLPSLAFGFKTCSMKWKADPQNQYVNRWELARRAWGEGLKVIKCIGYDNGKADSRRVKPIVDAKYDLWYPLREWGWDRAECIAQIEGAGLPVPVKSACYFCPGTKKAELLGYVETNPDYVQRGIQIERNASVRLTKSTKGLGRSWTWEETFASVGLTASAQTATLASPMAGVAVAA